mgnify:CR=1 FL=1
MDTKEVTNWVIESGKIAMEYFRKGTNWHIKADDTFVSDADKAVEEYLVGKIQKHYSDHRIIAEEGSRFDGGEFTWATAPIDGTSAFIWGWCTFHCYRKFTQLKMVRQKEILRPYRPRTQSRQIRYYAYPRAHCINITLRSPEISVRSPAE